MKRRLIDALLMFAVCGFSLTLLVYVAGGKAGRTYEQFSKDAAFAMGQLAQSSLEGFLRLDLPLRQFAGFGALTDPLLTTDSVVSAMTVVSDRGEVVFANQGPQQPQNAGETATNSPGTGVDEIVLPLHGKFDIAGKIIVKLKRERASLRVAETFRPLWMLVLMASAGFAVFSYFQRDTKWTAIGFATTFIAVSIAVTIALVPLFADGASAKGRALVASLSGRLDDVINYGINFDQIEGVDRVFADYRRLNPDISAIALLIDGKIAEHTDPSRIGHVWQAPEGAYDYVVDISRGGNHSVEVAMALPKGLVYWQIAESIRNTFALFVASGFFAYFFMELARSLAGRRRPGDLERPPNGPSIDLGLIKPIFFVATFVEQLNSAFLPQYVQEVVRASGVSTSFTSLPFIAFYFCFAASLIPAGWIEQRCGPHKLTWGGLIVAATGLLILAAQLGFVSIVAARALSGLGQGIVFIGVQSYILRGTDSSSRTRGASIIVVGYQAGMISGMAIGSLLVSQLGAHGVFELAAVIAGILGLYTWAVVPDIPLAPSQAQIVRSTAWRTVAASLRDFHFLTTIGLIGLPAKAVLTGVVLFALPLLLSKQGFGQEDIGQITMIYAAAVIMASAWVAARADRSRATGAILAWGAVLSGAGLVLISSVGWGASVLDVGEMVPTTLLVVVGIMTVGIAHGFINAPIITHVTESRISSRLGAGSVSATYRLLERAGHTAGPIVVGQVVAYVGSGLAALGWIGGGLILMGLLFAMASVGKADLEIEAA